MLSEPVTSSCFCLTNPSLVIKGAELNTTLLKCFMILQSLTTRKLMLYYLTHPYYVLHARNKFESFSIRKFTPICITYYTFNTVFNLT